MKKTYVRWLATMMVIVLIFCSLPLAVSATGADTTAPSPTSNTDSALSSPEASQTVSINGKEYTRTPFRSTPQHAELTPEEMAANAITIGGNEEAMATMAVANQTPLEDGVYAFRNVGNPGLWMDIQEDRTEPGYHAQQYAYGTSPAFAANVTRPGLYAVTRISGTNRYAIRLMIEETLSLYFSGTDVLTKTIFAQNEDLKDTPQDTFYIVRDGDGYTIRPYGSSLYVAAQNTTASGAAGAPDSYLQARSLSDAGNRARWIPQRCYDLLPEGVYAFQSVANEGRWMDIQQDSAEPDGFVQQYAFDASPTTNFSNSGLFKLTYAGDNNRYIIRSMLNNALGLGYDSAGYIRTGYISTEDYDVHINDTFYLIYDEGGYRFRKYNSDEYICAPNSMASGHADHPYSNLQSLSLSEAGDRSLWTEEPYYGIRVGGVLWQDADLNDGWELGVPYYFRFYAYTTEPDANTTEIDVSVTCLDGTVLTEEGAESYEKEWDPIERNYAITVHQPGTVTLYWNIKKGYEIYHTEIRTYTTESLVLPEGEYLFRNREIERYMQIDDDADTEEEQNGAHLELHEGDGEKDQVWMLDHVADGYYAIISVHSGLAVSVQSQYLNSDEESAVQQHYAQSDRQLWKIIPLDNGFYKIKPKSSEGYSTDWVLAAGDGAGNGLNVEQRDYVESSYLYQWNLYIIGEGGAFLLGVPEKGFHDHTSSLFSAFPHLFDMGYDVVNYATSSDEMNKEDILNQMSQSKIFVSRSHGSSTATGTSISLGTTSIRARDIFNFQEGTVETDLSNCDLIVFVGCKTADHNSRSLLDAAVLAGAACAVGFENNIWCSAANRWTELFFEYLSEGLTVENACDKASNACLDIGGVSSYTIVTPDMFE